MVPTSHPNSIIKCKSQYNLNFAKEQLIMYCKNCGKPNPDDATFCSNCGERLKDIGSSNKEDSLLDRFQGLDAKHKKWIYIYLVYVLIVFILSLDAYYDKYDQELLMSKFIGSVLLYSHSCSDLGNLLLVSAE